MHPLLVFDLDGTLADTAGDLVAALNAVVVPEGLEPVRFEEARAMVGAGARALIGRAYASQDRTLDPAHLEVLFQRFLLHYDANIANETVLYPGVADALDRLAARGFAFAICTNKMEAPAKKLMRALGASERFRVICGQDTYAIAKPDSRVLTMTIAAAGGALADSMMIGDSGTDIATAKAAGVPVIAGDFGYTDRPVAEFGPDCVISHFDALDDAVDRVRDRARTLVGLTADGRLS